MTHPGEGGGGSRTTPKTQETPQNVPIQSSFRTTAQPQGSRDGSGATSLFAHACHSPPTAPLYTNERKILPTLPALVTFFWGVDRSTGWDREPASSRVLRLEPLIILCVSLVSRAPRAPPLPSAQEPAPPPSPCPAFSAPVPPRPTQVAAAGSGCRQLRFPRPPRSPVQRAAVKGGSAERRDTFFPFPSVYPESWQRRPGVGHCWRVGGPSSRMEKKEESRNYRERT